MLITLGILSFVLFLLGDINDVFWHRKWLKCAFPVGFITLVAATASFFFIGYEFSLRWGWVMGAIAAVLLMIWSLFFSFPAEEAYVTQSQQRMAVTDKMYALCRHPGVLWFCVMYGMLIPGIGFPVEACITYCMLNIGLALAEDIWLFPKIFSNYPAYKKQTPFLIPNADSVRSCIQSFGKKP